MENKKKSLNKGLIIYFLLFVIILILILPKEIIKNPNIMGAVLASVRIISSNPPTFDFNLKNQTINQSSAFLLDVNCSDADAGDVITYYDNFAGFEINGSNGIINQTNFDESFIGNNTINISCSDGKFNTSQNFILTILKSASVSLSQAGCPPSSNCSSSLSIDILSSEHPIFTSNFTIATNLSTPTGVYFINITGEGNGVKRNATFALNVTS